MHFILPYALIAFFFSITYVEGNNHDFKSWVSPQLWLVVFNSPHIPEIILISKRICLSNICK